MVLWFRLKEKIEELENKIEEICPHKRVVDDMFQVVDANLGCHFFWFKCETCGKLFKEQPKGSKVKMVVYK